MRNVKDYENFKNEDVFFIEVAFSLKEIRSSKFDIVDYIFEEKKKEVRAFLKKFDRYAFLEKQMNGEAK